MKSIIAIAVLMTSAVLTADLLPPALSNGVTCWPVAKNAKEKPDLTAYNKSLTDRVEAEEGKIELKSVSVTPLGDGFLVCSTGVKK